MFLDAFAKSQKATINLGISVSLSVFRIEQLDLHKKGFD